MGRGDLELVVKAASEAEERRQFVAARKRDPLNLPRTIAYTCRLGWADNVTGAFTWKRGGRLLLAEQGPPPPTTARGPGEARRLSAQTTS